MTAHDDLELAIAGWLDAKSQSSGPAVGLERVLDITSRRRPRPAWLAGPGSRWVGEADSPRLRPGVGAIPRLGLRWSTALVLLLIIAALLGAAIMIGARQVQPAPLATGQLGHLAYVLDGDIYVADWDGRNPVRIAESLPVLDGPSPCLDIWGDGSMWSPDGRHLAYRSGGACPGTVHVTDPEGDEIASFPGTGWLVSWSPDSTRIATWVDDTESQTIGIYGLDGVRQALLNVPNGLGPTGEYDPQWSPDGRSLLMKLGDRSGPIGVWELPVDGGTPKRVPAEDPRSHWNVEYSPDGALAALVDGGSLVVAAADGSESRVLASGLEAWLSLAALWSPTGDRIAFSWTDDPHDDSSGPYTHELRLLEVASGNVTTLASDRGTDPLAGIAFSPEGDQILFSNADGLWSVKTDGSDAQLLVSGTSWGDWQWQENGS